MLKDANSVSRRDSPLVVASADDYPIRLSSWHSPVTFPQLRDGDGLTWQRRAAHGFPRSERRLTGNGKPAYCLKCAGSADAPEIGNPTPAGAQKPGKSFPQISADLQTAVCPSELGSIIAGNRTVLVQATGKAIGRQKKRPGKSR